VTSRTRTDEPDHPVIEGDATHDAVLQTAGIVQGNQISPEFQDLLEGHPKKD
jgi:hypothetical protein